MHTPIPRGPRRRPLARCLSLAWLAGCAPTLDDPREAAEAAVFPLIFPPAPDAPVAVAETYYATCDDTLWSMSDLLRAVTNGMVNQRIPYSAAPEEWRDCSGNFLRLSSYVASICPGSEADLAAPAGVDDYEPASTNHVSLQPEARSTRELARWYHAQERFVPIWYDETEPSEAPASLDALRHLIKPGAVLWFSYGRPLQADGIDQLFSRGPTRTHINHIGTVVQVERDLQGRVVSYAMFHGRNRDKLATITVDHRYESDGRVPPFGYGSQHLVGIGALLPPASPPRPPAQL